MCKKTALLLLCSMGIMLSASAGFAASAKEGMTPFTDTLQLTFDEFPDNYPMMNATYHANQGINISGETSFGTNYDSTTISSSNLLASGHPSLKLFYRYPGSNGPIHTCQFVFTDGPWVPFLHFKNYVVPTCAGLDIGSVENPSGVSGAYAVSVIYDN